MAPPWHPGAFGSKERVPTDTGRQDGMRHLLHTAGRWRPEYGSTVYDRPWMPYRNAAERVHRRFPPTRLALVNYRIKCRYLVISRPKSRPLWHANGPRIDDSCRFRCGHFFDVTSISSSSRSSREHFAAAAISGRVLSLPREGPATGLTYPLL